MTDIEQELPPLPAPDMEDVPYEQWGQNMVYPALWAEQKVREYGRQCAEQALAAHPKAEPVAWRMLDGEGGFDFREELPDEASMAWSAQYGRKWEPLYARPAADVLADAERYRELYAAAKGLSFGEDWNNGTHAKLHGFRKKLIDAVAAIDAARAKGGEA